jgi:hypothetical protein
MDNANGRQYLEKLRVAFPEDEALLGEEHARLLTTYKCSLHLQLHHAGRLYLTAGRIYFCSTKNLALVPADLLNSQGHLALSAPLTQVRSVDRFGLDGICVCVLEHLTSKEQKQKNSKTKKADKHAAAAQAQPLDGEEDGHTAEDGDDELDIALDNFAHADEVADRLRAVWLTAYPPAADIHKEKKKKKKKSDTKGKSEVDTRDMLDLLAVVPMSSSDTSELCAVANRMKTHRLAALPFFEALDQVGVVFVSSLCDVCVKELQSSAPLWFVEWVWVLWVYTLYSPKLSQAHLILPQLHVKPEYSC